MNTQALVRDFFIRQAELVARDLLGMVLTSSPDGKLRFSGRIVETEAYLSGDPASHAYRGRTPRNSSMFLSGGHAYVYTIYGLHRCLNVVTGEQGVPAAVLIRALEPLEGIQSMWWNRYGVEAPPEVSDDRTPHIGLKYRELCGGPGRICSALGIDMSCDGMPLADSPGGRLGLLPGNSVSEKDVGNGPRVGLSRGHGETAALRWFVRDSPFLSRRAG